MVCIGRIQRKVLHRFVMMAKRQMPTRIGDQTDAMSAEDRAAQEGNCSGNLFFFFQLQVL